MSQKELDQVKKSVEEAMHVAEEERRRKLLTYRLEVARSGIAAYQQGKVSGAVKGYKSYIRILEEAKNISEGGLVPAHFDPKKEIVEMLTLCGVYWDLMKIYDQARSVEKRREFQTYATKFVMFSKGMPYQQLCAESLRKYMKRGKSVHTSVFRKAYIELGNAKCFVVSSLADLSHEETLPILRGFRDQVLKKHRLTRNFVAWYYRKGPRLSAIIDVMPYRIRWLLSCAVDFLAKLIWLVK